MGLEQILSARNNLEINKIGKIPKDLGRLFVAILKKPGANECKLHWITKLIQIMMTRAQSRIRNRGSH